MTIQDKEAISSALRSINPFMLRSETAQAAYNKVVGLLFAEFPLGFVDVALFMMKYQRLSATQARSYCGSRGYAAIMEWSDAAARQIIRHIMSILLKPSGCKLNDTCFHEALIYLDSLLEKQEVKGKRTELIIRN